MTALHLPTEKLPFTIDMLRDDVRVIETRGGSLKDIKSAFEKMHRILEKMPISKSDTAAELASSRESRGA